MRILERAFGNFGSKFIRFVTFSPEMERAVASATMLEEATGLVPQPSARTPKPILSRSLAARENETVAQMVERVRRELNIPLPALEQARAKLREKSDPFRVTPRKKAEKAASARRKPKASDLGPFRVTPRQKEEWR